MVVARTRSAKVARRRPATGPLPQIPHGALAGPRTLEDRLLPGFFVFGFVVLMAIQAFHALGH